MNLFDQINARKIHGQRNVFSGIFTNSLHKPLHLDCDRRLTNNNRWYKVKVYLNYFLFLLGCDYAMRRSPFSHCPSDDCGMGWVHLFRCWLFSLGPFGDRHSHLQDSKDLLLFPVCLIKTSAFHFFNLFTPVSLFLSISFDLTFFLCVDLILQLGSRTSWRYLFYCACQTYYRPNSKWIRGLARHLQTHQVRHPDG